MSRFPKITRSTAIIRNYSLVDALPIRDCVNRYGIVNTFRLFNKTRDYLDGGDRSVYLACRYIVYSRPSGMRRGCRAYVEITRSSTGVNYSSSSTSKEATFSLHLRHASLIRALRIIDKPYLTFFPTIARAYTRKPASYRFERLPIKTYVIIIRLSRSTVFSLLDFDFISQLFLAFLSLSLEIYFILQF